MRLTLATLLNGLLLNLAGVLSSRPLPPWKQWPLGALIFGALFVVPWVLMRKRDGARAQLGNVMLRNGVAWLLGGFLPMQVVYSIVVRPMGTALTLLAGVFFVIGGAIAGGSAWSFYDWVWPLKRVPR